MNEENRMALLIDAENISAQYAGYILDEVANYGVCSYKRIYGSWDRIVHTKWEGEINKNSLKPVMLFNNTKGKNASDSALIIDAMDILYMGDVDGFCIVSSDSDFTSLARRLIESGKLVIGMGESDKATEALENAYDKFVYIDLLAKEAEEEKNMEAFEEKEEPEYESEAASKGASRKKKENSSKTKTVSGPGAGSGNTPSKRTIENKIKEIIMSNDDLGKATDLGQIGNALARLFRNFDVRYYDKKGGGKYKYLKEFVSDFKSLELSTTEDNRVYVRLHE